MNIPDDIDSYTREKAFDMQIFRSLKFGVLKIMRALVGKDTAEGKHEPGKLENILDNTLIVLRLKAVAKLLHENQRS